jgi:hypothetical protein
VGGQGGVKEKGGKSLWVSAPRENATKKPVLVTGRVHSSSGSQFFLKIHGVAFQPCQLLWPPSTTNSPRKTMDMRTEQKGKNQVKCDNSITEELRWQ